MSNTVQITVPDIGDFSEVEVIEVLVSEGDAVAAEQSLITVESDKASMEIPSSRAGVVKSLKVKVGDKIKQGSVILDLESAQADSASSGQQTLPAAKAADASPAKVSGVGAVAGAEPAAIPQPVSGATGSAITVTVPDIGDSTDVEVIEIMVAVGDTISVDQSLITVESDKASMEVPSSHAGVVTAIKVKLGDKVNKGSDILELKTTGAPSAAALAPAAAQADAAQQPVKSATAEPAATSENAAPPAAPAERRAPPATNFADGDAPARHLPHASPSVRKMARELGVDLQRVTGSGDKQRITHEDVRQFVKQSLSGAIAPAMAAASGGFSVLAWPKVDFAKFGPTESKPLSRIKKLSGANLHRNWVMIPHVTNNDTADITDLEALRVTLNKENQKAGIKVTMLAFLIKAVVAALKKFPEFNASLDGDNLVFKQYHNIGFAADTPNGLVVPVIRDVDKKGILDIASETAQLAGLARDGKLSPAQMQGGCFSISSLGGIGGTTFTPIINAPEVAILGVSRSAYTPVWDGQNFQPRLLLPLSLSYDHRVIDGALAARFNAYLSSLLADFRRIAL